MLKNAVILILVISLVAALWPRRASVSSPEGEFGSILATAQDDPTLAGAAIGFCVLDERGEVLFEENARTAFIPASSLKTLTTATALEMLGPDFRFVTELKSTAPMQNGVIDGDLIIVGGGDPMLRDEDLQNWAQELRERGLKTITGRIRGDGTLFRGTIYNDFWNWGDVGNGYGSGVSGLNVEHNRFLVQFNAGSSVGAPATLVHTPSALQSAIFHNEVSTAESGTGDGVVIHGGEGDAPLHLRGTVPLGAKSFGVMAAVPDPVRMAVDRFVMRLRATGRVRIDETAAGAGSASHSILTHESPRLADIITSIHATSDNHETECVFRMLGVKAGKPPAEVVRQHWKARGLDFTALRMVDGCGLARANVITPYDLARLQFIAGTGPRGKDYRASLLGEDGLRGKGGAMSGVRTFTGFATSKTGVSYCFAFMVNHTLNNEGVSALRQRLVEAMREL